MKIEQGVVTGMIAIALVAVSPGTLHYCLNRSIR